MAVPHSAPAALTLHRHLVDASPSRSSPAARRACTRSARLPQSRDAPSSCATLTRRAPDDAVFRWLLDAQRSPTRRRPVGSGVGAGGRLHRGRELLGGFLAAAAESGGRGRGSTLTRRAACRTQGFTVPTGDLETSPGRHAARGRAVGFERFDHSEPRVLRSRVVAARPAACSRCACERSSTRLPRPTPRYRRLPRPGLLAAPQLLASPIATRHARLARGLSRARGCASCTRGRHARPDRGRVYSRWAAWEERSLSRAAPLVATSRARAVARGHARRTCAAPSAVLGTGTLASGGARGARRHAPRGAAAGSTRAPAGPPRAPARAPVTTDGARPAVPVLTIHGHDPPP